MRRNLRGWVRGGLARQLAVVALSVVASGAWARVAHAESAEVEALIAQGNDLRRQGQSDRALPLFQKAYGLVHTPRTAGQLGLAEVAVGDFVEAEKHLGAALESPQHPWVANNRAGLEKMLTRARAGIGELIIAGGPAGAAVAVNGRPTGAFPLAAAIKVNAGRVDVEVTAPGHVPAARSLHVDAGEHQRLTVNLEKAPTPATAMAGGSARVVGPAGSSASASGATGAEKATAAASSSPMSAPAEAPGAALGSAPVTASQVAASPGGQPATSGLRTAAWVVAGGAVLGLGAGLGLQLAARGKLSDFDVSCDVMDNKIVPKTMMVTMQDCESLYNTWNSDKRWSIVGYVTGAALAVTSGVLFWSSRPASPAADLRAHVTCAPGPGTFFCRGEF